MDIEDATILAMTNVDKNKLPPIHQKRILAFVNHFIINTSTFLNNFAAQCETRFLEVERKMQKVEAALLILESKLSSISGLESIVNDSKNTVTQEQVEDNKESGCLDAKNESIVEEKVDASITISNGVKACEDNRYKKYFKMMQFGVPIKAIKAKMETEGFNPDILDNPNQILEDGVKEDIEPS